MDAPTSFHPTDQSLRAYGLGKLDESSAEAINAHLESCVACRRRTAEMSSDSFLSKFREGQSTAGSQSGLDRPGTGPSLAGTAAPFPVGTLPPELEDHKDYEVVRELGRGGMGVVYLVRNRLMGRNEVLKVMGRHLVERPEVSERFLREIRAVASLRHPNIVAAHHAFHVDKSIAFTMEFVDGYDLSKMVKSRGPLPVAHACLFIHQAALGLQHAHEEGMVHRDIKPGNLMVSRRGERAVVKVLDFGLAKAAREGQFDSALTHAGQMLGTPDFIAPEQSINAQKADIRADIYSLGCTLYYLLTGGPPFRATSLYDLLQAHHSMDAKLLNFVRPEVPTELAALVAKMMAKEPERRFQTPEAVSKALAPFYKKGTVTLPKPETSQVATTEPQRKARVVKPTPTEPLPASPAAKSPLKPTEARPESMWASLIDFREPEQAAEVVEPVVESSPPRRWIWPAVAAGVLLFGFAAAWMGGVLKVKTPDGVIVLENLPKDSEVYVDGNKVTISWPGIGKAVEIRTVPGQRKIEVRKDGFSTFVKELTVKSDGSEEVTIRLEPLVAVEPKKDSAAPLGPSRMPEEALIAPPELTATGFVSLFNGKDLTGWKAHPSQPGHWTVENGVMIGSGSAVSHLYSKRDDYKNFHLVVEARINDTGNSGVYFRAPFGPGYPTNRPTWLLGYEAQINKLAPDMNKTGSLYVGAEGAKVSLRETTVGSFEWFKLEVVAVGNRIVVKVNGRTTADFTDDKGHFSSGHIALQQHDPQTIVEFRNIEIQELDGMGQLLSVSKPRTDATAKGDLTKKSVIAVENLIHLGMRWSGTKVWTVNGAGIPVGTRQEISLEITEVSGEQFKGIFTWENNRRGPVPVKGRIDGNNIEWTGDGQQLATYQATIDGKSLKGSCNNGTFTMDLVEGSRLQ
jgi:serine/threonine protein kinase